MSMDGTAIQPFVFSNEMHQGLGASDPMSE